MKKSPSDHNPKYPVQTVGKALEIIELLSKEVSKEGLGISELSAKLEMGKSTVHRLLDTLSAYRYVERCPDTTKYRLGWKMFEIGNLIPQQRNLYNIDTRVLQELCTQYGETVNLGVRVDHSVVTISKMSPKTSLIANLQVGAQEPIYATAMGKVLMSEMSKTEVMEILGDRVFQKFTPNTIANIDDLIVELARIRMQGYSIDDEEFVAGLSCISMPVRDFNNEIVAGISVSGPSMRLNFNKIMDIKIGLEKASTKLSTYLGLDQKEEVNLVFEDETIIEGQ
ncbi:Transcriptional regulator IclR-like protein [Alkaliphilus metalliredigens QYMF]|uniref:Transcriptional regulator IclR-like protein n=1 Tax=Alkaliphilus metalliredigens (strain QYMF) TaxID=293826 RepID=A6TMI3_ALKMQ|nr:Transcriptional regulator IclR-like protein [Alkaliphilus metalliredigens QYMF]